MPSQERVIEELVDLATGPKPLLILMVGPPCSGKSSFTAELKTHLAFALVNTDNSVDDMRTIEKRAVWFRRVYHEALAQGKHVVVDQTNVVPYIRKERCSQAPHHYKVAVDMFSLPYARLVERSAKREKETGRVMPGKIIWQLYDSYRPPQLTEGFDAIYKVYQE